MPPGDLHGDLPDDTARAEDEHLLAGPQPARQVSAIQAATADSPSAATSSSGTPAGSGIGVGAARRTLGQAAVAGRHPGVGA